MKNITIYEDTINPFNVETAKQFVYEHRNVFDTKTIRKTIYADKDLIVIKEYSYFHDLCQVWFWGFSKRKRGTIIGDIANKKAIEIFKESL